MVSYSFNGMKRIWTQRDQEENERMLSRQPRPTGYKMPNEIKTICMENSKRNFKKWPVTQIMRLLRLYSAHRCLWDVSSKGYRDPKIRQTALADMAANMGDDVTTEQIVEKIHIIRSTYRLEKKRIKQRMREGLEPQTRLKWFVLAHSFLKTVPNKRRIRLDPTNSDSDLEDAVVTTINPYCPLLDQEHNYFKEYNDNSDLQPAKTTSCADKNTNDFDCSDNENSPKEIKLEFYESDKEREEIMENKSVEIKYNSSDSRWSLKDTFKFMELLKNHDILWNNCSESSEFSIKLALESIANEMKHSFKGIEKRWHILRQVYDEEKQKILENPQYKPVYKWWSEAENLFEAKLNTKVAKNLPTETIFFQEIDQMESSSEETYETVLFPNQIESAASSSNETLESNNNFEDVQESSEDVLISEDNYPSSSTQLAKQSPGEDLLKGKWSLKHSVKFLRLYGAHRCLWDLNDPCYRCRMSRIAAIEDIAAAMGHGLDAAFVANKIKIFRTTYMQQRKRLIDALERGEKPEIFLKWFPLADCFLRPHISFRFVKADAKEIPQFDFQYVYDNLNSIDPDLLSDFRGNDSDVDAAEI